MTVDASFLGRLKRRLRHGLMTQEILDRLARLGLVIYPYYLVRELPLARPEIEALGEGLETRFLDTAELTDVSEIRHRPLAIEKLMQRQEHGRCFGIWESGQLAAYSWYSSRRIPTVTMAQDLCELPPGCLYLYDAYVRPEYRGRQLAVYMRHKFHEALQQEGADSGVSISLAFNKSSRKFKSKLGAEETELRLLLGIPRLGGFDMRLSQSQDCFATPRIKRLHASPRPKK